MRALPPALAAVLVLAACSATVPSIGSAHLTPADGGAVTEAVVGPDGVLNPLFEQTDNDREINSLIYQGLTTVGPDEQVKLQLARSMTVSDDRLSYTLDLKPGIRWADGRPFIADDVLFTYQTLQSPAYAVQTEQVWKDIQVAQLGPMTVRFTLEAPSASFPLALRQGIIPQHVFAQESVTEMAQDPHSGEKALGTGPFRVQSFSRDRQTVVLTRSSEARPRPRLDGFEFRSYPSLGDAVDAVSRGEADTVGALDLPSVPGLAKRPDLVMNQIKTHDFVAVMFNLSASEAAVLNPPAVRQALAKAVDREKIVQDILGGRADPAFGPIPPTDWGYARTVAGRNAYDPEAAKKLLDQAGWTPDPKTGTRSRGATPLALTLVTADGYPYKQVAEQVQSDLRAIGVDLTVQPVSLPALVSQYLMGKQFQLALTAVDNGPDPDQYALWHSGAAPDSINFAGALMPHQALLDKDLEDGRAGSDQKSRQAAYLDFQDLMAEAAPAIFLFEPHYTYLVSRRVHGVTTNPVIEPVDRFQYVAGWYVNTHGA